MHLTVVAAQAQFQPPNLVDPRQNLTAELIARLNPPGLLSAADIDNQNRNTGDQGRDNDRCSKHQVFGEVHPRHCM